MPSSQRRRRAFSALLPTTARLLLFLFAVPLSAEDPKSATHSTDARPAPKLELTSCRLPGLDEDVLCGTYEVYENRDTRTGRKIPLRVAVLPALGESKAPDPVVAFAGGPGDSVVDNAFGLAYSFAEARQERDILLVDVRGTGGSAPLYCEYQNAPRSLEEALETFIPVEKVADCRDELAAQHDLARYTTPILVDDVDEVRTALGYPQINLFGGSYGSRAVLVYIRRHPEVVRSAIVQGVAPTHAKIPLTFARDAQAALDALFDECADDADCHAAFPNPAADLAKLLARLDHGPIEVEGVDPATGELSTLRMTRPVFVQTLRYMLYQPLPALQIPAFLDAAREGDLKPFAQMALGFAGAILTGMPEGLYLAVTCTEDVLFIPPKEAAHAHQNTFLGDFRYRQQRDACIQWEVRGELPPGYHEPVRADVPVLILSGERDPVTPVRWAKEAARHLPKSRHLVVPDAGHGFAGLPGIECVGSLNRAFLDDPEHADLDLEGCRRAIERPGFLLSARAEEAIDIAAEDLAPFVGTYVAEQGIALEIVMDGGRLRIQILEDDLALVPVEALRFVLEGAPPGTFLKFAEHDGVPSHVELFQGGAKVLDLARRPAS